jgi:hypothetical protein
MRRELPAQAIASIEKLIDSFSASNADQRERISGRVDGSFAFVFEYYARVSATEAVRKNDPALLQRGLIALAIANDRVDYRDNLPYLSMIYNSAAKLRVDPTSLFRSVGDIAIFPFRKALLTFLQRDEKSRTVESFRFRESGEGGSFNYEFVEPSVERPSLLRWRVRTFLRKLRRKLRRA